MAFTLTTFYRQQLRLAYHRCFSTKVTEQDTPSDKDNKIQWGVYSPKMYSYGPSNEVFLIVVTYKRTLKEFLVDSTVRGNVTDANISLCKLFNSRKRNLLLNYINLQYKGQDKRLKSFQSTMDKVFKLKNESGPLEILDDLISKVGLSPKEAAELCEEIAQIVLKKRRNIQVAYPNFTYEDAEKVNSLLAIHSSLYCITWAHLEKSGRLLSWHKQPLPLGEKHKHPIDCVQAVMSFYDRVPVADAYIFETPDVRRAKDSSEALNGFLLSNINCSLLATIACVHAGKQTVPRLHYLNRSIVPLLFDLSVGVEVVSRFRVVEKFVTQTDVKTHKEYNGVVLDSWLHDLFMESNDTMKEELSIPLLSAMAAMEILVRQNPYAIDKIYGS